MYFKSFETGSSQALGKTGEEDLVIFFELNRHNLQSKRSLKLIIIYPQQVGNCDIIRFDYFIETVFN